MSSTREYLSQILSADVIENADSMGKVVIFPKTNQLLLDIDTREDLKKYHEKKYLLQYWGHESERITPSQKEGHFHIVVTLSQHLGNYERIALQACLGSDLTREILSCVRQNAEDPHPTLLLENK